MFEEKKIFQIKDSKELLEKHDILKMFVESISSKRDDWYIYQVLIKKGEDYHLKGLEATVYPLMSDGNEKMVRINYSDFAKEMLKEIDGYRLIHGDVYKICEKEFIGEAIKEEGDYILSISWNPEFIISASKVNKTYIFDLIKFQSFDKNEFLNYIPRNQMNPGNQPNEIQLEAQLKRNSILHGVYKQILKHHTSQ
jgi:hypothetical protein